MIIKVAPGTIVVYITVGILLLGLCERAQADITLASDGQSDYTIVIDRHCSPSEQHGAEELQKFLEQICGAKLPIRRIPVSGPMILVGRSKILDRLPVDINFEALGNEGFVIKTVGSDLVLAGGRQRGTMYACYEFLDKFLGCRWFTPEVTHIPHRPTIELPNIDYQKVRVLEYREPFYTEAFDGDWAARNRMNSNRAALGKQHGGKIVYKGFVHTFYSLVSPGKYFEQHPEYFSEIDGKRTHERAQLCLTNPDVVKIATESVRQWLRDSPEVNIVSVSQNDCWAYCECEKCRALAEHEGSQAGPILHFVNQIADNIKDEFPDVAIDTLAYQYSRKPPQHIKPRPNVIVRLCSIECCFSHPLSTCDSAENTRFREDIIGWSKMCNRLHVWDYVTNFAHYIMPFPNLYSLQPNIKFFIDHNVKGIFEEGNYHGGGEFAELRSYIMARCLWNPDCNWKKEMNAFLQAYYGPAAGPIRQYIALLHQKVQEDNIHVHIYDAPTSAYLTKQIINQADELFDKAQAAVADDPVLLLRVHKERLPIDYVKISRPGECFSSWQEYDATVEEFARIAKEWGIARIREGALLDERLKQWRENVKTHKEAAEIPEEQVTIQPLGGVWRFAIDPDEIGVSENWFDSSFDDGKWAQVRSDQRTGWERQGFPDYTGFGWYRQSFQIPDELNRHKLLYLYFGAIDEDAYIYLNGEQAYEHSCASTGLAPRAIWVTPFAFQAHACLKFGQENTMAVRVYNRFGMGGIYRPVYLIGADRELDASLIKALIQQRAK